MRRTKMSYVDEYREMVSDSRVVFSSYPDVQVFSYPDPDGYDEYGWEVWRPDYETVIFTEDRDWLENDCAE
jgi:hypothetical protein